MFCSPEKQQPVLIQPPVQDYLSPRYTAGCFGAVTPMVILFLTGFGKSHENLNIPGSSPAVLPFSG
jgi:hypothetical protein